MNIFYEHHRNSINGATAVSTGFLNELIQPFQQPERVIGFFNAYRDGQRVTRQPAARYRRAISELGKEPGQEMGFAHPGSTPRERVMILWMPTLRMPRLIRWWSFSSQGNRPFHVSLPDRYRGHAQGQTAESRLLLATAPSFSAILTRSGERGRSDCCVAANTTGPRGIERPLGFDTRPFRRSL